ncbi:MAG: lysozyme inhibitor LprI family protein [Nitrospirota bacterium]
MPTYRLLKVVVLFGFLGLPLTAQPAGFDCKKASTPVEQLICNNPELSELDTKLSLRYEQGLVLRSSNQPALRKQQREWLRNVRDKCKDTVCLTSAYHKRFEWTTTKGKKNPLCEEFRVQENRRIGLAPHALPVAKTTDQDATHTITNIDIDGDRVSDQILLFHGGSASLNNPDYDWFSVVLSTTGNEHRVEAPRLGAIGYKSRYYLFTSNYLPDVGPVKNDVYRLGRSGIQKICSYECDLPDGNCSIND